MSHSKQPWLLIFSCCLLCPLYTPTHSTPVVLLQTGRGGSSSSSGVVHTAADPCPHASIAELIRTSPVILKALGARVFTDADFLNGENGQNGQTYFLTSATLDAVAAAATRATKSTTKKSGTTTRTRTATKNATWNSKSAAAHGGARGAAAGAGRAGDDAVLPPPSQVEQSILITLTPETIYKGASLLKMTPGAESAARSSGGGGGGAAGGSAAESAHQYEGQLNATLEPLACFDGNVLKLLPTELIAFGKLVTVQQQQQEQQQGQQQQQQPQQHANQQQTDILRISINGLHRWSPQFENHIWKHLGWDDWSDFTVCSVTCGKGVQQRFRRCLLDNPTMVDLNMNLNMNLNAVDNNDDDDDVAAEDGLGEEGNLAAGDESVSAFAAAVDDVDNDAVAEKAEIANELRSGGASSFGVGRLDGAATDDDNESNNNNRDDNENDDDENLLHKSNLRNSLSDVAVTAVNAMSGLGRQWSETTATATTAAAAATTASENNEHDRAGVGVGVDESTSVDDADNDDIMRVFVGNNFNESADEKAHENVAAVKAASHRAAAVADNTLRQRKKRRKSAKSFSTMFCEGYNIEQRNCNTFECSDDISDLLKFYKKFPMSEDTSGAAVVAAPTLALDANAASTTLSSDAATQTADTAAAAAGVATTADAAGGAATNVALLPSSTPANMGYVRSWRNALNFTLMLTLRVKNDSSSGNGGASSGSSSSRTTATVFSIRNATHNLYLEPCKDGLRLYLERDNTTEMLPVKFNLYDYRWHQVAISIQNGDFISIYVDCSWTNSFVVSKRLFSLPLDADVEIGRGFNGELQQLLVLPENQERQQCSSRRTSINEVKRYIIDTFIDDYGGN